MSFSKSTLTETHWLCSILLGTALVHTFATDERWQVETLVTVYRGLQNAKADEQISASLNKMRQVGIIVQTLATSGSLHLHGHTINSQEAKY